MYKYRSSEKEGNFITATIWNLFSTPFYMLQQSILAVSSIFRNLGLSFLELISGNPDKAGYYLLSTICDPVIFLSSAVLEPIRYEFALICSIFNGRNYTLGGLNHRKDLPRSHLEALISNPDYNAGIPFEGTLGQSSLTCDILLLAKDHTLNALLMKHSDRVRRNERFSNIYR